MLNGINGILGLTPIINNILNIIKRVVPDKSTQDQLEHEIAVYQLSSDFQNAMAQIEVNREEAANENIFVSGWRPFIGWVCGIAFVYHVLLVPLIGFIASMFGHPIALPVFDQDLLSNVLYGMLGLGGFRTAEKIYKEQKDFRLRQRVITKQTQRGPESTNYQGK